MPDINPLLRQWTLPPWSSVHAEHLLPAVETIVADNRQIIAQVIASQTEHPNWDDVVIAVDEADARLNSTIAIIETLAAIHSEDRAWIEQSALSSFAAARYKSDQSANLALFETYQRLAKSSIAASFHPSRTASLNKILRRFRLSGIHLPPAQKQKLSRLNQDIDRLQQLFMSNLARANAAWSKDIDDVAILDGLSPAAVAHLARNAQASGRKGWRLTMDQNTWHQVMKHAKNRALREEYFHAWCTQASDQGPQANQFDNEPVINQLLALRHEKATVLGFENFAQLTLENRMADSTAQVQAFLQRQIALLLPEMARDAETLQTVANEQGLGEIQPWDQAFLVEQLRQSAMSTALKTLPEYFPLDGVLRRLCVFCEHLFAIRIREKTEYDRWHEQIRLFEISEHDQVIGYIYVDPFHRSGAQDYAWTGALRNRHVDAEGQLSLPIAILYSNFTMPTDEHPCLLSHENLRVLFHEFGHCLQQVLTRSPHLNLSGIAGAGRDAVEFAGQLFEHWCLSPEFLLWLASHHQTGERLSEAQVQTVLAAQDVYTSRETAMLLLGALFDFELHSTYGDGRGISQVFEDVLRALPLLKLPVNCRFANSFDYLATGYEASVYAYKWSGVLATEAFKRFEREGVFNAQTGKAFREAFFSPGDAHSLLDALALFLGHPSDTGHLTSVTQMDSAVTRRWQI
ncbi:Oligopeptidase A [Pseudomonas sp. IT-347P]|uniref:M3 family metallopeptidase n=1 Tax=Pseudomonas sp. IT-347P TaxID=3026458 RepID=UPI0039E13E4F